MKKTFAIVLFFSLVFYSCTTMADYNFSSLDGALSYNDFNLANQILERNSKRIYSKHDEVLECLDKGILLHFDGRYAESNEALSSAEKLMEAYQAKSISQSIGAALVNDTVMDYAGEDFEDIYTNIFMCLNYIALNQTDDAMVEIRRFDNKMKNMGNRYQVAREQMQKEIKEGAEQIKTQSVTFHNSALARYLSMLLYRADGLTDDARIDLQNITTAFKMQGSLYNFSEPANLQKELRVEKNTARINFVAFSGFTPVKEEEVVRIALPNFYYKLALPVMKSRASFVSSIKIKATGKENGGVYQTNLSKIESIDNIAKDTFNDHYGAIAMRAFLRSISKTATGTALSAYGESEEAQNTSAGAISSLLGLFVKVSTEFTERADVRSSRYFPGAASVGSIDVPPGTYDLQIEFYSSTGKIISTQDVPNFVAKAGNALNLAEAICYH